MASYPLNKIDLQKSFAAGYQDSSPLVVQDIDGDTTISRDLTSAWLIGSAFTAAAGALIISIPLLIGAINVYWAQNRPAPTAEITTPTP